MHEGPRAHTWLLGFLVFVGSQACGAVQRDQVRAPNGEPAASFVPPSAYEQYVRGEALLASREYARAAQLLAGAASSAAEEDDYLYSRLALALSLAGDEQAANEALARADGVNPCSVAAFSARGELLSRQGRGEEAVQAYARARACDPESTAAQLALAEALLQTGARERAKRTLEENASPRARELLLELALLDGDSDAALVALRKLRQRKSETRQHLRRALDLFLRAGNPALALRLARSADQDVGRERMARILMANALHAEARALLERSPVSALGDPETAGALLLDVGLHERAELALLAAHAHSSSRLPVLEARALAGQQRLTEAAERLEATDTDEARAELRNLLEQAGLPAAVLLPER